jgi:hypothetical protein
MKNGTEAKVKELPMCQAMFCKEKACYDAKIPGSGWMYTCEEHFKAYGMRLGIGLGQRLILVEKEKPYAPNLTIGAVLEHKNVNK